MAMAVLVLGRTYQRRRLSVGTMRTASSDRLEGLARSGMMMLPVSATDVANL